MINNTKNDFSPYVPRCLKERQWDMTVKIKKSLDTTLNVSKSIYSNYLYIQSFVCIWASSYEGNVSICGLSGYDLHRPQHCCKIYEKGGRFVEKVQKLIGFNVLVCFIINSNTLRVCAGMIVFKTMHSKTLLNWLHYNTIS